MCSPRVVLVGARFGQDRSFFCGSIRSTRAVVSTWFSSTTPTRSAATRRSASKHAASTGSFTRRGRCAAAPRSTTRPHTSPSSPIPTQLPRRYNRQSTTPAISALFVSRWADTSLHTELTVSVGHGSNGSPNSDGSDGSHCHWLVIH